MKVEQAPKFQPITITLETSEEAEALWDAVRDAPHKEDRRVSGKSEFLRILSDWFTTHAQLGGGQ